MNNDFFNQDQNNSSNEPAQSDNNAEKNAQSSYVFSSTPDPFYQSEYSADFTQPSTPKTSNGYSIAALVLGIVSLVCCCYPTLTIVLGILAIIFAIVSRKGEPMNGKALAGMICGIIAIVLVVLAVFSAISSFLAPLDEQGNTFYDAFMEGFREGYEAGDIVTFNSALPYDFES